ncbi:hypothetical protein C5B85_08895 [Pseudoclavibacter sp. AY1F1]|uniref:hypothetical protein n=1 Tax=Pseudoclavibacter sp. AY1F1 TaxID=2080583 RepID=UPI000CE76BDD|nr:hypothetical protein [Pseudoclavibacter sp. AY1F1]PPF44849.1 hypothetical protein C5B85_08895 [Pseudoclavibacter sp. AY1F1]
MWLIDAIVLDFDYQTSEWRVQVFRVLLGLACLVKNIEALRHGGWKRFENGSFERHRLISSRPGASRLVLPLYRVVLILRVFCAFGIIVGFGLWFWISVLILAYLLELCFEFRFHTVFTILMLAILATARAPGVMFNFSHETSSANTWTQGLAVVAVTHLYVNSAWMKLRSRQFMSGRTLAQFIYVNSLIGPYLSFREFWYPRWLVRVADIKEWRFAVIWKTAAVMTVVAEIILPLLLLSNFTYDLALVAGIVMHALFTFLLPRRLLPFSIATVSTYLLFQP